MNMANPLKKLISPKLVSPLSPRILNTSGSRLDVTPTYKNKRLDFRHKLDFPISPLKNNLFHKKIEITVTDFSQNEQKLVQKKDVLINTPVRQQILREGLTEDKSVNILGWGGFGKVIRALYGGQTVALKVVKNNNQSRERNALNLCHENIVKIINIINNDTDGYKMVIMEYYENSVQLLRIIEDFDMNLTEKIIDFSIDIAKGLEYCHKNSIFHLDIKPSNILVCQTKCKICDFGNSVSEEDVKKGFKYNGTTHYSAPELLLGHPPTEKCDIYSLGIVFWQMKRRKSPYQELLSNDEIIYKVVKYCYRPEMMEPEDTYSKLYQNCWSSHPQSRLNIENILQKLILML